MEVQRNVEMQTRDGVVLRADVYRPAALGSYPCLLIRTPYGKEGCAEDPYYGFERLVAAGYVVVCQDVRGRHASGGHWASNVEEATHDVEDGCDAVEWAARLPMVSGRVGTFGASYEAFLQWKAASGQPPSLVAMAAASIPARYLDLEGPGTIRPGKRLHWWITKMAPEYRRRSGRDGTNQRSEGEAAWSGGEGLNWLYFLPWLDLPREVFEDATEAMKNWLRAPHRDPWGLDRLMGRVTVPNLDFIGWFDHCSGDVGTFKALVRDGGSDTARRRSRIVIGPWCHSGYVRTNFGRVDFGEAGLLDGVSLLIRWFDYWLKGIGNGLENDPRVLLFVMGDCVWRPEAAWPLRRARDLTFFLSSAGHANTPSGDGVLLRDPDPGPASDSYVYDPRNPVPDLFGPDRLPIPADQEPLAHRQDILVYQSAPLEARIEVTGNPLVDLTACSSVPDTDFFVRLIDVRPDGLARDVSMGLVRTRYRNGLDQPSLVEPGSVQTYRIPMSATSNAFLPGHRIRLDVTSSCFPSYDRNHNTPADQNADAELRPASQQVLHGGGHNTRLVLPWIPDEADGGRGSIQ